MKYEILKVKLDIMNPNRFKTLLITPNETISGEREPSIEAVLREGWEPFHSEETISRIEWIFKRSVKNGNARETLIGLRILIKMAEETKQSINSKELIKVLTSIIEDL